MEKSSELLGLLIAVIFSAVVCGMMLWINALLGPKNKSNPVKAEPFECGLTPITAPQSHLSVRFHLVAMFFVLFDIAAMYFVFWAVAAKTAPSEVFGVFGIFWLILSAVFFFAWKQKLLELA